MVCWRGKLKKVHEDKDAVFWGLGGVGGISKGWRSSQGPATAGWQSDELHGERSHLPGAVLQGEEAAAIKPKLRRERLGLTAPSLPPSPPTSSLPAGNFQFPLVISWCSLCTGVRGRRNQQTRGPRRIEYGFGRVSAELIAYTPLPTKMGLTEESRATSWKQCMIPEPHQLGGGDVAVDAYPQFHVLPVVSFGPMDWEQRWQAIRSQGHGTLEATVSRQCSFICFIGVSLWDSVMYMLQHRVYHVLTNAGCD